MKNAKYVLAICGFIVALINANPARSNKKDVIGFPELEENLNLKNRENRQPVYAPSICPVNELFYPGDQKDDWICDCRPAYLYHPATDACWAAFRKGPCAEGQILVLLENAVIPTCKPNPCETDGLVSWSGKCEKLGSKTPCGYMFPVMGELGVNATTLAIGCVRLTVESRFSDDSDVLTNVLCSPGSKRGVRGTCVST